ncbi:Hypothetical predicted protein [Octopus vulgaris]|uniref:Uncharacterized protein n=1 Tax=Octopus vulgaris TaxID=6645 RepID=A0AA36F4Z3_OCTVU|nr:Hypothetical predicted protein [Octopus vulgaris]
MAKEETLVIQIQGNIYSEKNPFAVYVKEFIDELRARLLCKEFGKRNNKPCFDDNTLDLAKQDNQMSSSVAHPSRNFAKQ